MPKYEPSDAEVNLIVAEFPDGLSIEQIAVVMGFSRQRADWLVKHILRKLAARFPELRGCWPDDPGAGW